MPGENGLSVTSKEPRSSDKDGAKAVTRYGLRHRTSGRSLAFRPSLALPVTLPLLEADHETDAFSCSTMTEAELERADLREFADAYEVVPVTVETSDEDEKGTEAAD